MIKNILYSLKRNYHFIKTGILRGFVGQILTGFSANKLKIISITGTDGKTTTSTLLYHILKNSGLRVGLLTTVAAYMGDIEIDTGLHVTSPDPLTLHRILQEMTLENIEYVVLETTSHGAYQYRDWGIKPLIAGLTNITHEHLDYHLNYTNYVEAKSLILKKAKTAFVNEDDQSYQLLKNQLKNLKTYSKSQKIPVAVSKAIKTRFMEPYNNMNAKLAYNIAHSLGVNNRDIAEAIKTFSGIPGRMQSIQEKPFKVVIDFAHTPNALESTLVSLRKQLPKNKKLIAVYGSAGLRDTKKRPMMGKVGADNADLTILTAEDPRTENIWSIIRQMKEQLTQNHNKVVSIADRKIAIEFALKAAKPGDIVGIFGKGHEKSMCYGKIEYPWDDGAVAREFLS